MYLNLIAIHKVKTWSIRPKDMTLDTYKLTIFLKRFDLK